MALDFLAGCVGGCAGVVVGHPLDTVKVRLQTQDYRKPIYRGTWHCFTSIARKESIAGLYRGVTSPLGGVALVNAIVFGVYGNAQRFFGTESLGAHFMAGAVAGISTSIICSPMEMAKTRMQISNRFNGPLDCLTQTYKTQKIRGVFKGLGLTLLREAPAFGTYFATYEYLTAGKDVATWQMLLAGGVAGSASWVIVYPVDVLKTRIQSDGLDGPLKYRSALHCLQEGLKTEGAAFLGRGIVSTIIRAFPTNAVTFTVVAWTLKLADQIPQSVQISNKERDSYKPFSFKCLLKQSIHLFEEGTLSM